MKIYFADFWPNFPQNDNYFYHLLSTQHDVEIDSIDPDIVFFSLFGNDHIRFRNHRSKKVFFTGENRRPPLDECDISFSFDPSGGKNIYLPLWVLYLNWFDVPFNKDRDISYLHSIKDLVDPILNIDNIIRQKTNFCSFIVGNPNANLRIEFCKYMQTRTKIDCPGNVLNNCDKLEGRGDEIQKINYLKSYKFNIAFENSFFPGYVTEKIIQPMFSKCIPIYWGGTEALRYFNKNSFIWAGDYEDADKMIDHIMTINNDKDLFVSMIKNPVLNSELLFSEFSPKNLLNIMKEKEIII